MIEQRQSDVSPLRVQGFGIDLLKHVSRPGYRGFGSVQELIAGLAECGIAAAVDSWAMPLLRQRSGRRLHEPVKNCFRVLHRR
jgi:hypothetical protein